MALKIPADAVALAAFAGYDQARRFMRKDPKHKPRKAWKKFALDFEFWKALSPADWGEASRKHFSLTVHGDEPGTIEEFWARLHRHRHQT